MSDIIQWLYDSLKSLTEWFYEQIISSLSTLLNLIPVPDFLLNLPTFNVPAYASFIMEPFHFDFGLQVIVAAYTFRFILRRLPFIG